MLSLKLLQAKKMTATNRRFYLESFPLFYPYGNTPSKNVLLDYHGCSTSPTNVNLYYYYCFERFSKWACYTGSTSRLRGRANDLAHSFTVLQLPETEYSLERQFCLDHCSQHCDIKDYSPSWFQCRGWKRSQVPLGCLVQSGMVWGDSHQVHPIRHWIARWTSSGKLHCCWSQLEKASTHLEFMDYSSQGNESRENENNSRKKVINLARLLKHDN